LILGFGIFADNRATKIRQKEAEKREVLLATVRSSQHILNNLLNQMQLALFDSDGRPGLEAETRKLLDRSIKEGKEQVECLSSVTDMDGDSIEESVRP
jgi:plasmid stability protein